MSSETKTEAECKICEQSFRIEGMKEGKCAVCAEKYPKAQSKAEVVLKKKPKARTLTEDVVKEIVYEILEQAGIVQKLCEKCGQAYFPKSPAAKQCEKCRVRAVTASSKKDDKKDSK
jgi:hypothetical protein